MVPALLHSPAPTLNRGSLGEKFKVVGFVLRVRLSQMQECARAARLWESGLANGSETPLEEPWPVRPVVHLGRPLGSRLEVGWENLAQ